MHLVEARDEARCQRVYTCAATAAYLDEVVVRDTPQHDERSRSHHHDLGARGATVQRREHVAAARAQPCVEGGAVVLFLGWTQTGHRMAEEIGQLTLALVEHRQLLRLRRSAEQTMAWCVAANFAILGERARQWGVGAGESRDEEVAARHVCRA